MTGPLSAGQILGRSFALIRGDGARAGAALVVMAGLGILIDAGFVSESNSPALNLVASGVNVAAAYWITKGLLQDLAGLRLPARFPAFFGLGLLTSLGILLGTLVVVVPGLILLVRWSVSAPILLDGDDSVTEAMQQSWRLTGPHFWAILLSFVALYGSGLVIAAAAFAVGNSARTAIVPVVLADVAFNAALIAGWYAAVAIHLLLGPRHRLEETFA